MEETMENQPDKAVDAAAAAPAKRTVADQITELAPAYFSELMQQFIEKKDLTDRQKIRRRVRALLDLFSADTKWPTDKGPKNERPGQNPFGQARPWIRYRDQAAQPADDLAEPPAMGAFPAPGADLAEGEAGVPVV
jgi:hypothetical protein